jgi:hypothetical protein
MIQKLGEAEDEISNQNKDLRAMERDYQVLIEELSEKDKKIHEYLKIIRD